MRASDVVVLRSQFFVGWWWSLYFLFVLALLLPLRVLYLQFFSPLLFLVFSFFFFFFPVVGATNIPGVCFYSFSSHAQVLHLIFLFLFSLVMTFLIYVTSSVLLFLS